MPKLTFIIFPGIIGLVLTIMISSTISPDIRSFGGTYNVSQVTLIRAYDKSDYLTYKPIDNESFTVAGSMSLTSNQVIYLQTNGITVKQTYPGLVCTFAQVFVPIVFIMTMFVVVFRFRHTDSVSNVYRHRDDPVSNPKYENIGPIHRNKNYDRVDRC